MGQGLTIRRAKINDVDLLFEWTNDPLVRKYSFTSDEIIYESHCKWFENKLKDENSIFYILEKEGVPVGLVRFDIMDEIATIGVSIDKEYRGKGLGAAVLNTGISSYFKVFDFPILAYIKKENLASVKSFEKAGFQFYKEDTVNGIEAFVYQLKNNNE